MTATAHGAPTPGGAPVLVAGAGPVGLTLAHELRRRGVAVRLVDAAPGPAPTSRAIATHARTLETYDQMGLVEAFLARGRRIEGFTMFNNGTRLVRLGADYRANPTAYPYTLSIEQAETEAVLRDALADRGVEVEWNTRLTGLEQNADSVTVTLQGPDGKARTTVYPWVVGCDGGHSAVRKLLELPLVGDSNETWLLADARVSVDVPADSIYWVRSGTGTLMAVPLSGDRWRLLDTVETSGADDPELIARRFATKLAKGFGRSVEVDTPTWISVFTAQQRMVPAMRVGRCMVAGDAAHVHSPASGQGMNTGIQEAYNLAWKLAMVVDGTAAPDLLDSYGAERVPVGEKLLRSTRKATRLVALREAMAGVALPVVFGVIRNVRFLRGKMQDGILGQMSGLTIEYGRSPLTSPASGGDVRPRTGERVVARFPLTSAPGPGWTALREELRDVRWTLLSVGDPDAQCAAIAADYADVLSVRTITDGPADAVGTLPDPDGSLRTGLGAELPGAWLLVRPDGYVAERGDALDRAAVERALARAHVVVRSAPLEPAAVIAGVAIGAVVGAAGAASR